MSSCPDFLQIAPGVATWSVYSKECKTQFFAHAHVYQDNLVLVDPVLPASAKIWSRILSLGTPNLIVLTNGNHERHSLKIAREYGLPVATGPETISGISFKPDIILDGNFQIQGLRSIACPGAGPGETALFSDSTSTLMVGDALIHLPETGFQLLPDKYCTDASHLVLSLLPLLDLPFKNLLMAHGIPITRDARRQLRDLLTGSGRGFQ